MNVSDYDPVQFGRLIAEVDGLKAQVQKMSTQMEELVGIVNQGRGAFWLAVLLGSTVGGIILFILNKLGMGDILK